MPSAPSRVVAVVIGAFLALSAGACDPVPRIAWDDARTHIATDSIVDLFGDEVTPAAVPLRLPAVATCPGGLHAAREGSAAFAAWWAVLPDSSAHLLGARSSDGGETWSVPFVIDTLDRSRLGCARPAPALAVHGGEMYVAYGMRAVEGTGIFFAHWMMGTVHTPVAVLYGDRVVPVALAIHDSTVAVAHEDPSSRTPSIGVAVSRTQGHAFEYHARASTGQGAAVAPVVDVRRDRVAVSWAVPQGGRLVRVGRLN